MRCRPEPPAKDWHGSTVLVGSRNLELGKRAAAKIVEPDARAAQLDRS